jgi:hypothetical protein
VLVEGPQDAARESGTTTAVCAVPPAPHEPHAGQIVAPCDSDRPQELQSGRPCLLGPPGRDLGHPFSVVIVPDGGSLRMGRCLIGHSMSCAGHVSRGCRLRACAAGLSG